jgi:hypothetical protein
MPKCTICPRLLYKYDEVIVVGKSFHKSCFICKDCKKPPNPAEEYVEFPSYVQCVRCNNGSSSGQSSAYTTPRVPETNTSEPVKSDQISHPPTTSTPNQPILKTGTRRIGGVAATLLKKHAGEVAPGTAAAAAVARVSESAPTNTDNSPRIIGAAAAPKCTVCNTSVYKTEEAIALGRTWHKSCFTCGGGKRSEGCKKILTVDRFESESNDPFCVQCYKKITPHVGASAHPSGIPKLATATSATTTTAQNALSSRFAVSAPRCPVCDKSVYKAEEVTAINQTWHKSCFRCGGKAGPLGCKKVLTLDAYVEHLVDPYCKFCFAKLMKEETETKLHSGRPKSVNLSAPVVAVEPTAEITKSLTEDLETSAIMTDETKTMNDTPVVEEPTDTPVVEEPTDTPVVEEPADTPVVEEPTDTPVVEEPADTPVVEEPTDTPVVEEPTDTPVVEEPTDTPVVEEPADTPVVEEPTDTPVVEEPTDTPVVEEPTDTPIVEEPTDTPVVEEPTDTPVEEEPTDTPVVEEPTDTPIVEEPTDTTVEEEPADTPVVEEAPEEQRKEEEEPDVSGAEVLPVTGTEKHIPEVEVLPVHDDTYVFVSKERDLSDLPTEGEDVAILKKLEHEELSEELEEPIVDHDTC